MPSRSGLLVWSRRGWLHHAATSVLLFLVACGGTVEPSEERPDGLNAPGSSIPDGFVNEQVLAVPAPTALDFLPDRSMLVTSQAGQLFRWDGAESEPILDLTERTCSRGEQGLLGVAVDPNFERSGAIFLYYTHDQEGECFNRVGRFVIGRNNRIDLAGEVVLVDRIPSVGGNHNGGDLQFGNDGHLYVGVGDGGCAQELAEGCAGTNMSARHNFLLLGKILRITPDGGIPADNPFVGEDGARCNEAGLTQRDMVCQEIFATGLRNPFRLAFDPNNPGTRLFANDPGQDRWEEIDEVIKGGDYGWNLREGHCANGSDQNCGDPRDGLINPIHDYHHGDGPEACRAITGGAFVPSGVWPVNYQGEYLFADFGCGAIFRLADEPDGSFLRKEFITGLGPFSIVHLRFGPFEDTQALFFTTFHDGGAVRRIVHRPVPNPVPSP